MANWLDLLLTSLNGYFRLWFRWWVWKDYFNYFYSKQIKTNMKCILTMKVQSERRSTFLDVISQKRKRKFKSQEPGKLSHSRFHVTKKRNLRFGLNLTHFYLAKNTSSLFYTETFVFGVLPCIFECCCFLFFPVV